MVTIKVTNLQYYWTGCKSFYFLDRSMLSVCSVILIKAHRTCGTPWPWLEICFWVSVLIIPPCYEICSPTCSSPGIYIRESASHNKDRFICRYGHYPYNQTFYINNSPHDHFCVKEFAYCDEPVQSFIVSISSLLWCSDPQLHRFVSLPIQ